MYSCINLWETVTWTKVADSVHIFTRWDVPQCCGCLLLQMLHLWCPRQGPSPTSPYKPHIPPCQRFLCVNTSLSFVARMCTSVLNKLQNVLSSYISWKINQQTEWGVSGGNIHTSTRCDMVGADDCCVTGCPYYITCLFYIATNFSLFKL